MRKAENNRSLACRMNGNRLRGFLSAVEYLRKTRNLSKHRWNYATGGLLRAPIIIPALCPALIVFDGPKNSGQSRIGVPDLRG